MFLVMVNEDNILQELVLVTTDRDKAEAHFFDTCSTHLSNWDEYTQDDKDALLDMGYEKFGNGKAVVLIDTDGPTSDEAIIRSMKGTIVYYVWKELVTVEGETEKRLITPWADPQQHEFPMDLLFDSSEAARKGKVEWGGEDEDWVLCRETLTPLSVIVTASEQENE